jgi:hypothetical protein
MPTVAIRRMLALYTISGEFERRQVCSCWCYVASWHNVRAQLGAFEGTETASLPTLDNECRFTVAFQTQRQAVSKVVV